MRSNLRISQACGQLIINSTFPELCLRRSYGASFAVKMQQKSIQCACKDMYHESNGLKLFCNFTQYSIMNIPLNVKGSGCMGNTHTICYQSTFLAGSKDLNLVSKK